MAEKNINLPVNIVQYIDNLSDLSMSLNIRQNYADTLRGLITECEAALKKFDNALNTAPPVKFSKQGRIRSIHA